MGRYLLRRLVESLITLFLATIVVFLGIHALPGDPARVLAGEESDPAAVEEVRHSYGLDQPLPVQYVRYMGKAFQGDLGKSARTGLPVTETIRSALPVTLELAFLAMLVALIIGLSTGVTAAVRRRGPLEWGSNTVALLGLSIPNFWFAILVILLFSVKLQWLAAGGFAG